MLSYNNLCTLFYESDDKQFAPGELEYYRTLFHAADGPILEVMAGSGRFMIPFLQEGFEVDGMDASPFMLEAARQKCESAGLSPRLIQGNLDDVEMSKTYALIACVSGSFSLLFELDEMRRALANCRRHLDDGGRLVLEVPTPEDALKTNNVALGRWVDVDETRRILLTVVNEYDKRSKTGVMLNKYELFDGPKLIDTELEVMKQRYWELDDIAVELKDVGFRAVEGFKPYGHEPPGEDEREVLVVATV